MKPNTLLVLQSVAGIASALPASPRGQAGAVAKRDDVDQATADNILQAMAVRLQMEVPAALQKREKSITLMDEAELKEIADNINAQLTEAAAAMGRDIPPVDAAAMGPDVPAVDLAERAALPADAPKMPTSLAELQAMSPADLQALASAMSHQIAAAGAAAGVPTTVTYSYSDTNTKAVEQGAPSLERQMQALAQQLDAHKQAAAAATNLDTAPIPPAQLEQAAAVSPDQLQAIADQMNAQFEAAGVDPAAPAPGAKEARQLVSPQQIAALAQQLSENLAAAAAAAGINPSALPTPEQDAAMAPADMQALADAVKGAAGDAPAAGVVANPTAPATAPKVPSAKRADPVVPAAPVLPANPTEAQVAAAAEEIKKNLLAQYGGETAVTAETERQITAAASIMAFSAASAATGSNVAGTKRAAPVAAPALPANPSEAQIAAAAEQIKQSLLQQYGGAADVSDETERQITAAASIMAFSSAAAATGSNVPTKRAEPVAAPALPANPTEAQVAAAAEQIKQSLLQQYGGAAAVSDEAERQITAAASIMAFSAAQAS